MKLANKKPLKYTGKKQDEIINNENVIMLYNVDFNGKVNFELAEILDEKNGIYKMLKNGEIRQSYPFVGYNNDENYEHVGIHYSDHPGGVTEKMMINGFDYADIDREDNIVFVPLGHMFTDRESRMYKVRDYFHTLEDDPNIYKCCHIEFGNNSKARKKFNASFVDKNGIFSKPQSKKSDWNKFLKDMNEIYERFITENKWYTKNDADIVLKEEKKHKNKINAWIKKVQEECG